MSVSKSIEQGNEHQPSTPQQKQREQERQYHPHLDGIRGVTIALVVLYHLGWAVARHSWLSIATFFALSGLLITGISLDEYDRSGAISVIRFWARRVGRLLPALLLLVIMICAVSIYQQANSAVDLTELFYLRGDLLWALAYSENFHLIAKKDDYFAGFQSPSVMRHIWTLAIEEQYYIIWPTLFYLCTKIASQTAEHQSKDFHEPGGFVTKKLLWVILVSQGIVVGLSYIASIATLETMGTSAAYYSTWSRCGDFACGGLVCVAIRLLPDVNKRYTRAADCTPMAFRERCCLEICVASMIALLVLPGMVAWPLDKVLPFYFYFFRVPFSLLVMCFGAAAGLQCSEPLPSWAVCSKFLVSKPLRVLGTISYGLYLVHWPLIVWLSSRAGGEEELGDSSDDDGGWMMEEGETEEEARAAGSLLLEDIGLLVVAVGAGYLSFHHFESPLRRAAVKSSRPGLVVLSGVIASLLVAAVVMVTTRAAEAPIEDPLDDINDIDAYLSKLAAEIHRDPPLPAAPPSLPVSSIAVVVPPLTVASNLSAHTLMHSLAPPPAPAPLSSDAAEAAVEQPRASVSATRLPAASAQRPGSNESAASVPSEGASSERGASSESGASGDEVRLATLLQRPEGGQGRSAHDPVPPSPSGQGLGVQSAPSAQQGSVSSTAALTLAGPSKAVQPESTPSETDRVVLFVGDSVANALCRHIEAVHEEAVKCAKSNPDWSSRVKPISVAKAGMELLTNFLKKDSMAFKLTDTAIKELKPQTLVLHDVHAMEMREGLDKGLHMRVRGLTDILHRAHAEGVEHAVALVTSPFRDKLSQGKVKHEIPPKERSIAVYNATVHSLLCAPSDTKRLRFTVLRWDVLNCPHPTTQGRERCPVKVHGFDFILKDHMHPTSNSPGGRWVSAQVEDALLCGIAGGSCGDTAPSEVQKCLRQRYPPDMDPALDDILEHHTLCFDRQP